MLRPASVRFDVTLLDDPAFDNLYPATVRLLSRRFWTPVGVARRAAHLFCSAGSRHVLDVGAGVGKFALAAAGAAPGILFVGVEQREHLVSSARDLASQLRLPNVRFEVGDVTALPWHAFDGVYLFNPLAENLFDAEDRIDDRATLDPKRFVRDCARVERSLGELPVGTAVVTYHGSGTPIPGMYDLASTERAGSDWLHLWIKRRWIDDGVKFLETDDGRIARIDSGGPDAKGGSRSA